MASTTTPFVTTPTPSSTTNSSRDTLLIVTSVAMAIATLALVFIVRVLDRCSPGSGSTVESEPRRRESPAERAERLQDLIDEQATRLSYRLWVSKKRGLLNSTEETVEDTAKADEHASVGDQKLSSFSMKSVSFNLGGDVVSPDEPPSTEGAGEEDESDWTCDCAICLGEFENDEMVCELKCGHIFHEECVHGWFVSSRKPRCPVCRMEVKSEKDDVEDVEQSSNVPEQSVSDLEGSDGLTHRIQPVIAI